MKETLAMILAGGRGKRMDILCYLRPKPVLPFAGKLRVIDFTLSNCIHSQITDIAVLADYQRAYLEDYLERWSSANGGVRGLCVLQPRVGSYCGTAGAVFQNLDYLERRGVSMVLVLAGDHVYKMDYRKMIAFHLPAGCAKTTVLGKEVKVPDYTAIGRKCKVLPKAGLDGFASKLVRSGTIVVPAA